MIKKGLLQTIIAFLGLLITSPLSTNAQSMGTGTISCSAADTLSDIWFRHTYLNKRRPISGKLTITATGRYKIYINESNITPTLTEVTPSNNANTKTATAVIDISRYLRNDSNTIAILYHPLSISAADQAIAIGYYGILRNGKPFAHIGDNSWLCRPVPSVGNDRIDWGYTQLVATACWTAAAIEQQPLLAFWAEPQQRPTPTMQPGRIVTPRYAEHNNNGIEYEFGTGFYGYIRITLRGVNRGDTITINGYPRICRGETDEQITTWQEPTYYRRIRVTGTGRFKPTCIQRIEGICLKPSRKHLTLN